MVNNSYWLWDGVLSEEFCKLIINNINLETYEPAGIGPDTSLINADIRRTDVLWEHPMLPLGCIARSHMQVANYAAGWNYDIAAPDNSYENTQLTRYRSEDKGFYDWHSDIFVPKNGVQRKLTCVILLNDPSEFEGGVLQFRGIEDTLVFKKRGSIVVFPSFIEHRVTPVTKGVRYTAVTWANGPSFR